MNKKTILLAVAGLLIVFGLVKPDLSILGGGGNNNTNDIVIVTPPADAKLREICGPVISALKANNSRISDGKRLSSLYYDIATLIELDGDELVIKTTDDVKNANSLSGVMLRMDIKGKYPNLAKATNTVIIQTIGDDSVPLDPELRAKASESFKALSWACNEGSK